MTHCNTNARANVRVRMSLSFFLIYASEDACFRSILNPWCVFLLSAGIEYTAPNGWCMLMCSDRNTVYIWSSWLMMTLFWRDLPLPLRTSSNHDWSILNGPKLGTHKYLFSWGPKARIRARLPQSVYHAAYLGNSIEVFIFNHFQPNPSSYLSYR